MCLSRRLISALPNGWDDSDGGLDLRYRHRPNRQDDLDVRLFGPTSAAGSERKGTGLVVNFDDSPIFEKERAVLACPIGAVAKKYANI